MAQKIYFENSFLEDLTIKFNKLTKEVSDDNEKQDIAISLIIEKYQQLHKKLNKLRKETNLVPDTLDSFKTISEITNESNKEIDKLEQQISEWQNELNVKENEILTKQLIESEEKLITVIVGNKTYKVELAITDEEHEKGLSNRTTLDEDKGMLFVFEKPSEVSFWMKDTKIPLDIIFINDDLDVISTTEGEPESETLITEDNVSYVLEVNANSNIEQGDEAEFKLKDKKIKDKMLVLDSDGNVQMKLDGGERIFSRKHTKILIQFAKKAVATNRDNDYEALGKRMFKFLQVQSETEPEYVEGKE